MCMLYAGLLSQVALGPQLAARWSTMTLCITFMTICLSWTCSTGKQLTLEKCPAMLEDLAGVQLPLWRESLVSTTICYLPF